jgi:hypothetical protein
MICTFDEALLLEPIISQLGICCVKACSVCHYTHGTDLDDIWYWRRINKVINEI